MNVEPVFKISESEFFGIGDKKLGQKFDAILSYRVVEKTKSYTVLKITYIQPVTSKRISS